MDFVGRRRSNDRSYGFNAVTSRPNGYNKWTIAVGWLWQSSNGTCFWVRTEFVLPSFEIQNHELFFAEATVCSCLQRNVVIGTPSLRYPVFPSMFNKKKECRHVNWRLLFGLYFWILVLSVFASLWFQVSSVRIKKIDAKQIASNSERSKARPKNSQKTRKSKLFPINISES